VTAVDDSAGATILHCTVPLTPLARCAQNKPLPAIEVLYLGDIGTLLAAHIAGTASRCETLVACTSMQLIPRHRKICRFERFNWLNFSQNCDSG